MGEVIRLLISDALAGTWQVWDLLSKDDQDSLLPKLLPGAVKVVVCASKAPSKVAEVGNRLSDTNCWYSQPSKTTLEKSIWTAQTETFAGDPLDRLLFG